MSKPRFSAPSSAKPTLFALVVVILSPAFGNPAASFLETFDKPDLAQKPPYSVIADNQGSNRKFHNPALIAGTNGALIAAWSDKGMRFDNDPTNVIRAATSLDGGASWSEPVIACTASAINPAFIRARNGDAVLFYNINRSLNQDDTSIAFRRSGDNGHTWSEAANVDIGAPVAVIVHNGLLLPNGDWLISFHYDRSGQGELFSVSNTDFVAAVAISHDEGKTWTRYGAIQIPNTEHNPNSKSWAVEPAVFRLRNGTLGMIIRTRAGKLYQTWSGDNGKTWSNATPTALSSDNSKPAALGLADNDVLLLWNNTAITDFARRYPLLAALSHDGGYTWPSMLTIEDDPVPIDYPTAIEDRGAIKLVFAYQTRQIRLVTFEEQDFKRWTPINNSGAWRIADGVLQFTGGPEPVNDQEWLRWSKVIANRSLSDRNAVFSADFRFDSLSGAGGALAVFPRYRDESNWSAWLWKENGKIGIERQSHFGSLLQPAYSQAIQETFFDTLKPKAGQWYTVTIHARSENLEWDLRDRQTGNVLASGHGFAPPEGSFIGLGVQKSEASFDNVLVQ